MQITKILAMFMAIIMIAISGCSTAPPLVAQPKTVEDIVSENQGAVVNLITTSQVFYSIKQETLYCTAFHIGNGIFVSAAHCLSQFPNTLIKIEALDVRNLHYDPIVEKVDSARDLLILKIPNFVGPKLVLWDFKTDGRMPLGMEIVSLGFPGYFFLDFTFDLGFYRGSKKDDGVEVILSKDISYPGYSGGPIISLKNGKVIGIAHVIIDRTLHYSDGQTLPAWISEPVSVVELENLLIEMDASTHKTQDSHD